LIFVSILGTIVLNMSTIEYNNFILGLWGKTRSSILALLYSHSDESFYMRQIFRMANISPGVGQRELKWLTETGIIKRKISGHQVFFQANQKCQIFQEIKSIVTKTVGIGYVLRSALDSIRNRIKIAFLFGSVVRGSLTRESDIDLLIVGDVTFAEVVEKLGSTQEILNREINPVVFSPVEFQKKIAERDHFLRSILEGKFIYLIGDKIELRKLVKKRVVN